jgi:regulator of protease activity HflC (stomatin/prohibitin superfamily)
LQENKNLCVKNKNNNKMNKLPFKTVVLICVSIAAAILGLMVGMPMYNVWQQEMTGKAEFSRAEQNRRIKVEEAKAEMESAKYRADAEIIRAEGVAKANEIIGGSLKDNKDYLTYLWIQALYDESNSVIYVPTEANLPILEATRLQKMH